MSEYIIREEVFQKLHDVGGCGATDEWSKGYDEAIGVAIGIIEDTPSADVAPVVHGRWVYSDEIRYMPRCTNCGASPFKGYIPSIEEVRRTYKFCPCCSAKMDESEGNNNE